MTAWKVRGHGDIVELADNLWTVEAPTPRIPIPRMSDEAMAGSRRGASRPT